MRTSGFEVALFPYESIVAAFASVGIAVNFDEATPDAVFQRTIDSIEAIPSDVREYLKQHLVATNQEILNQFFTELQATLDRQIEKIILIPLHGQLNEFEVIADAITFVTHYPEDTVRDGTFRKYEIIIRYTNHDKIDASFQDKEKTVAFLRYIAQGVSEWPLSLFVPLKPLNPKTLTPPKAHPSWNATRPVHLSPICSN